MLYRMYRDARGEWRWRLVAANNRILADSGESYSSRQACLAGIDLVKRSSTAPVHE